MCHIIMTDLYTGTLKIYTTPLPDDLYAEDPYSRDQEYYLSLLEPFDIKVKDVYVKRCKIYNKYDKTYFVHYGILEFDSEEDEVAAILRWC